MKKRILLLVVTAMALFSAACSTPASELKQDYHVPSNPETPAYSSEAKPVEIPEPDNATPYQELLTKEIDIHSFMEKYCLRDPYGSGEIEDIAADIGIECLRETEAGALYSIHKVKQGGLLYVFYMNSPKYPEYHSIIRWFYVRGRASSKDFADLALNKSSIDSAIEINETIQIFYNLYNADKDYWNRESGLPAWVYLDDGILELGFKPENNVLTLFFKEHNKDYNIHKMDAEKVEPYKACILDSDRLALYRTILLSQK